MLGAGSLVQSTLANTLEVEVELADGNLRASVPDEADNRQSASSPFTFDDQVGLPALLKLLNLEAFRPGDYFDPEVAFLRDRGYIVDAPDPSAGPAIAANLRRQLGTQFFNLMFSTEELRRLFSNAYRLPESVHVQFSFKAESPAALALPWELLYQDSDFLFGGGRATLSRHLAYTQLQYQRPPIDVDSLRVLLIAPRPKGVPGLRGADRDALLDLKELAVEQLPTAPTFTALNTYVATHRGAQSPHVIHFDGHGVYGRRCANGHITPRVFDTCKSCGHSVSGIDAQGYLAFEAANGDVDFVSAEQLANSVGVIAGEEQSALRLVVVSACRSAVALGGSAFSGIAQRLVKARVPAVVAMQFEVRDDTAALFAHHLYESIVRNDPLPTALRLARTLIGGLGDDQWYRPVLYLGTRDNREGRYFNFVATPPVVLVQTQTPPPKVQLMPADSARNLTDPIRRGLGRLTFLAMSQAPMSEALSRYAGAFQDVADQLEVLGDYKALHDELHELYYDCYAPARDQLAALDESPSVLSGFNAYATNVDTRIGDLKDLAERANGRVEPDTVAWIADLDGIYTDFTSSLQQRDRLGVARAVRRMGTLLMKRSAQINYWIVSTASGVHLERIAAAMNVAGSDRLVTAGAEAVDGLRERMESLVAEHNRWQELEPNLQELRRNLESDVQAFVDDWPDALRTMTELCQGQAEATVQRLQRAYGDVDALLRQVPLDDVWSDAQLLDLRTKYAVCEREAGQRFVLVDKDLVALCKDLNELRAPLKDLADTLMGTPV